MEKISPKQSIFFRALEWYFCDAPREILKGWKNYILFNLNYFSIPLLLRTLFSPWRRYQWSYPRGFDLGKNIETFLSNMISRTLGAIVRIFFIIFGLLVEILIIFAGMIIFLGWFILPLIILFNLFYGFRILF